MGQTMSAQQEGMTTLTEVLKASPPMFESRWLDACSRVHPSVPVILFAPAIAILLTLGFERNGTIAAIGWAVGGYLLWTLTEYWMHRIVFHFEPEDGIGARLHWIIYGVHHDHPNDPTHYHVHHHTPRTRAGRRLRELHMRHHFQDDTRGFGVSAPWWDRVFGT